MAAFDPDNAQVIFTVRELLDQIRTEQATGFARLETKLASKADKSDVARMESRLDGHSQRLDAHGEVIEGLTQWRHDREVAAGVHQRRDQRTWTFRQKLAAGICTLLLVAGAYVGPILGSHIH